jgi:hypothetical protein
MANDQPDTPSGDYLAMAGYWHKVDAILGGVETMRRAGKTYLPQFAYELDNVYTFRLSTTKFTNVFRDIVENLAAKPFTEEAGPRGSVTERVESLKEDIDGQGNHIHTFTKSVFFTAVAKAMAWILVDYTPGVPRNATIEQERLMGVRPYWVHLPPERVLAVYSEMVGGVETIVHARIRETATIRDGYAEKTVERVRVFDRKLVMDDRGVVTGAEKARWYLYELDEGSTGPALARKWALKDEDEITIGVIPLVPVLLGERKGTSWQVDPPMKSAAELQVTLYQQESGLEHAKTVSCFPMLTANGIAPRRDANGVPEPLQFGPMAVLYAEPNTNGQHGTWGTLEPSAESLRFLAADVKETIAQLRELGRQPLTAQSGNLTVITSQAAAEKANSAAEAWALAFKDAVENALKLTAMWLKETAEAEFYCRTRFETGIDGDKDVLVEMRKNGDLSQRTLWAEMRRRNVLSADFVPEDEEKAILDEVPGDDTAAELEAAVTPLAAAGEQTEDDEAERVAA